MIGRTTLIGVPDQTYQPTLSQLRAFTAIAQHRHFGLAAASLGVSQPTLSQSLVALESGLGLQLVERSTRRVLITAAGKGLVAQAQATLEAADQFTALAAGTGETLAGALRMGFIPTAAPYVLPSLLAALRAQLPALTPRITEDQTSRLVAALRSGELDVALLALPAGERGLAEIPLYTEDFVLALPPGHKLAGKRGLDAGVVGQLPMLLLDEGHCLREQTLDVCRRAGVAAQVLGDTRAASLTTVVRCVAGGLGVTLLPEMALEAESARTDIAIARFRAPAPGRQLGLLYRASSARGPGYERLAEIMRDAHPGNTKGSSAA